MFSQWIINLIVPLFLKKKPADKKNTVYFPALYTIIGAIGALIFSIILFLMYFFPNGTESTWVFIGFGAFWLLNVYIVMLSAVWRITYTEESFTYRSMFGRVTKEVLYSDIVRIKRRKQYVFLCTKKKRYFVDTDAIGEDAFLKVVSRRALTSKSITQESRKKQLKRLGKHK